MAKGMITLQKVRRKPAKGAISLDFQKWLEIANNGCNCWKWLDIAGNVQNGLGWLDRAEIGWQSLEVTGNGLKWLERLEITGNYWK